MQCRLQNVKCKLQKAERTEGGVDGADVVDEEVRRWKETVWRSRMWS
jgi:hypothetical protein